MERVMTHLIYLHGFNSAYQANSDKILEIKKAFDVSGITYDSFSGYDDIHAYLTSEIANIVEELNDDYALIGTSLGGFWSATMSRVFNCPSIIINPAVDPGATLHRYENENHFNYATGEEKVLVSSVTKSYENQGLGEFYYEVPPLLVLDMGDELIDSAKTKATLSSFPSVVFEGGNHRFAHMKEALDPIQSYLERCYIAQQAWD